MEVVLKRYLKFSLYNYYGLGEVADYWEQVIKINQWQQKEFIKLLLINFLYLAGKKLLFRLCI